MIVTDLFENRPDETVLTLPGNCGGVSQPVSVVLNREHTLALYRDGALAHRFVCSPSSLAELCAGWLYSEGYTADSLTVSRDGRTATVQGASVIADAPKSGCASDPVSASTAQMLALFAEASAQYERSHGIHECVLKGDSWQILRTDIGRHNAMDKAIGAAILAGYDLRGTTLFSSGRINRQTVQKAARCGIGCLMSKAVITHDALTLARELGLKVLFRVKENGYVSI